MVRVPAAAISTVVALTLYGCSTQNEEAEETTNSTGTSNNSTLGDGVEMPVTTPKPSATCAGYEVGNPDWDGDTYGASAAYKEYLKELDVSKLYGVIKDLTLKSQDCWPADGPQDGDKASYAGLFGRLAWHCAGTLRIIEDTETGTKTSTGGCEGGNIRFWPEREWRDNGNLDHARALLAQVKKMPEYQELSWGDLITFAGTVGIKASGGPANKFCFGRVDSKNGEKSVMLGTEGITHRPEGNTQESHAECKTHFHWEGQDKDDHFRCNFTQEDGRHQASHSVGLIYVYPEGPQLAKTHQDFEPLKAEKHQRSTKLSALDVRDTFSTRMGWTDQETVALVGGGHTLGRAHGAACTEDCKGENTKTSGFDGAWTLTPSTWNYGFFDGLFDADWKPSTSPAGAHQWATTNEKWASTMRLTSDLALINDPEYNFWAEQYKANHTLFDMHFASAWYKLMHRSADHPQDDDLANDAMKCTSFEFV